VTPAALTKGTQDFRNIRCNFGTWIEVKIRTSNFDLGAEEMETEQKKSMCRAVEFEYTCAGNASATLVPLSRRNTQSALRLRKCRFVRDAMRMAGEGEK
jgi:hypothetical protein